MTVEQVVAEVAGFNCRLVELTGGEPLLQPDAIHLMESLVGAGYDVLLETGGSLPIERVPEGVRRIVDIKCPGSGEAHRNRWENLEHLRAGDELKFVVADRDDYLWAARQIRERKLERYGSLLLSPVHGVLEPGEMAEWAMADGLPVRIQIQLHKVLWPGVERGV